MVVGSVGVRHPDGGAEGTSATVIEAMTWRYRCPLCDRASSCEWAERGVRRRCRATGEWYAPPTPAEQRDARVDTHRWPVAMELAVIALRGRRCTVPGCRKAYETLDHRVPWARGGPTSVRNLWPMCNAHNWSKGDTEYGAWLRAQGIRR